MLSLNRLASKILVQAGVRACTDVTGFGLLGHAWEIATASRVGMRINLAKVPLLPGAEEYAAAQIWPGGMWRNLQYLIPPDNPAPPVQVSDGLPEDLVNLLFDPETSGGLLAAAPPASIGELLTAFAGANQPVWVIGEVVAGDYISIEA
jgi:selenide,water dikinase